MNISIRGEKLEITDAMKTYAKEKISKLEKYFESKGDINVTVLAKVKNHINKVEITIPLKKYILRVEVEEQDFYAAIDLAIDKLERQIRKNKTRFSSKRVKESKEFAYDYIEEYKEEEQEEIVKRKKINMKPMDEEEAILQMELLGHSFYLFKDADTNEPMLIYKRADGNYGLIEIED